jgi:MoxR-like ATPase
MSKTKVKPDPKPATEEPSVRDKFRDARATMTAALVQRDDEVDLALTAMLCNEHLLLVGPPGTAKSLLLDSLVKWCDGTSFSVLLNKFTTPEEVFGPLSVQSLKEDKYRRVTTGMLPEAQLAFLDECLKGSSAILNTMLRVLNEREFSNGDGTFRKCPLLFAVAASNEWPGEDGKELGALFDRFLFRKSVRPIRGDKDRFRLLFKTSGSVTFKHKVSVEEIEEAKSEVARMPWDKDAMDGLLEIVNELNKEGIFPGDRRMKKSTRAVRAWAWLEGSDSVKREHLEVLQHTLWDDPAEQPEKCSKVVRRLSSPVAYKVGELISQAKDVMVKSAPIEAVAKLKEIQDQIFRLENGPKVDRAMEFMEGLIQENYDKVVRGPRADVRTGRPLDERHVAENQAKGHQTAYMRRNGIPGSPTHAPQVGPISEQE